MRNRDITERHSIDKIAFYEDEYVKEFTLRHNDYPYTIKFSYDIIKKEFLFIDKWSPVLNYDIPTKNAQLHIEIDKDFPFIHYQKNIEHPTIKVEGNNYSYVWNKSYSADIGKERFSPPLNQNEPFVQLLPENFEYEKKGSWKSWDSFGDWQYRILKDLSGLSTIEKAKINTVIAGINNDLDKIKALYNYLQDECRYVLVKIETGGLVPYPAKYVARNNYGDCKALSNYFKAVLNYVGINSYYSLIYAKETNKQIDTSQAHLHFNHVILNVPLKDDTLWLDCTSDYAFGYLGTFTQNRKSLLIKGNNRSDFESTPGLTYADVKTERTANIKYNNGNASVDVNIVGRGKLYEVLHSIHRNTQERYKKLVLQQYFIPNALVLQEYIISEKDRNIPETQLAYKASSRTLFKKYGNDLLIKVLPLDLPEFESVEQRKRAVQIDYPIYKTDTLHYHLPKGYDIASKPEQQSIETKYGSYYIKTQYSGNKVSVIKSFKLKASSYSIDEYVLFYAFINNLYELEKNNKILLSKSNK